MGYTAFDGRQVALAMAIFVLVVAPQSAGACDLEFFHKKQQGARSGDVDPTEWDYRLQGFDWNGTCATGRRQSPVALTTSQAKPTTMRGASLKFGVAKDIIIINTGHSIQASGGPLPCVGPPAARPFLTGPLFCRWSGTA